MTLNPAQLSAVTATDPEDEEWAAVPGWEGYEVSDLGRVRSWRRCGPDMSLAEEPKMLKIQPGTQGYPYVSLCFRTATKRAVHLLVLAAFVGPCPAGMEACHGAGGRGDARLSNLRWDTRSANNGHDKHEQGSALFGEKNHQTRLTEAQVITIRERYSAGGVTHHALAAEYGVSRQHVTDLCRRARWQHLPSDAPVRKRKSPSQPNKSRRAP